MLVSRVELACYVVVNVESMSMEAGERDGNDQYYDRTHFIFSLTIVKLRVIIKEQ